MHVLFLANAFAEDGPGSVLLGLLPRLKQATGWHVELAALRGSAGPLRAAVEAAGIKCFGVAEVIPRADPLRVAGLRRLIDRTRPQVLVTSLPRPDIAGRLATLGMAWPRLVSLEHGLHAWDEKGRLGRVAIEAAYRATLPRVAAVVAVSRFVRDDLLRRRLCRRSQVEVIHNGIEVERFRPVATTAEVAEARLALGVSVEGLVAGCAGALREIKGQTHLIEAWRLMRATHGNIPATLLMAGTGPDAEALAAQAEAAGLGGSVRFLGAVPQPQMPTFYRALDLYIQPSLMESYGMAAGEALASGVPVVASAVGGLPEVVRPDLGELIAPGDPEALAQAIGHCLKRLARSGVWASQVRREAPAHIAGSLSAEQAAAEWVTLLKSVVA